MGDFSSQPSTEDERLAWGAREHDHRLADIAAAKRGEISLEEAQKRARKRSRESGMSPSKAYRAMIDGSRPAVRARAALQSEKTL